MAEAFKSCHSCDKAQWGRGHWENLKMILPGIWCTEWWPLDAYKSGKWDFEVLNSCSANDIVSRWMVSDQSSWRKYEAGVHFWNPVTSSGLHGGWSHECPSAASHIQPVVYLAEYHGNEWVGFNPKVIIQADFGLATSSGLSFFFWKMDININML